MFHLIGIKDIEMCSLAQFISTLGYKIDGSDIEDNFSTSVLLKNSNIKVKNYSTDNITDDMFIIVSDNIDENNIELERAKELGLKIYTCSQMKSRFTSMFETIAVSGCVGKDITTLMMTYVLSFVKGCNY